MITADFCISLDGYVAGPDQSMDNPLGVRGRELHQWRWDDPEGNQAEIDAITTADAYVMGRNMFGPDRGEWDLEWTGWWGEEPPYHAPVFVLGHHEREPLVMTGTTFHFVTTGIEDAVAQARAAVGEDATIDIAGGASTVNQALDAGLVDELRLHVAPVVLGAGERLFGAATPTLELVSSRGTRLVTHMTYRVLR